METIGLELSDAGFLTAACAKDEPRLVDVPDQEGATEWPGFCYGEGSVLNFGEVAENLWFVHPRRVAYNFWARLNHEPSALSVGAKTPSFSELAFFFLRAYVEQLKSTSVPIGQFVFALPGAYLKDTATEEEKIGLLLGMAAELKLPLAGMVDLACAALCDPRAGGFNPALPIVVVDLNLDGADVTLLTAGERLSRRDFIQLPHCGYAQLLKQLTGTMGNRFLRHTAFDILEDGRIEQTFFRQTKDFLIGEAPEYRFHINTATRGYEMLAKREQLAADANAFVSNLVQSVRSFVESSPEASMPCTLALTDRAAHIPGLEARLRSSGFGRILRLPRGAAACGAARIGASRFTVLEDLADVPVETEVPITDTRRLVESQCDARLHKNREPGARVVPTHAILAGLGHALGLRSRFTIGPADSGADLPLPASFATAGDCLVTLEHANGRLWFDEPGHRPAGKEAEEHPLHRATIEAGDRLVVRCGTASAEILFAHCPAANGARLD